MNGHITNKCRNKTRCLKCAGPHNIKECKETEILCANCGLNHKSTYTGCPAFQKYKNKIEKQNKEIQDNYVQKCEKSGATMPIQITSNNKENSINNLAKKHKTIGPKKQKQKIINKKKTKYWE